jgi:hypothetical protein
MTCTAVSGGAAGRRRNEASLQINPDTRLAALKPCGASSQWTHRWREMDSNPRSPQKKTPSSKTPNQALDRKSPIQVRYEPDFHVLYRRQPAPAKPTRALREGASSGIMACEKKRSG